jgi:hypothetical protein
MSLSDSTLAVIGSLSAELAAAETASDAERLAALVAACRTVEQRALASLSGRLTPLELLQAQQDALTALGW